MDFGVNIWMLNLLFSFYASTRRSTSTAKRSKPREPTSEVQDHLQISLISALEFVFVRFELAKSKASDNFSPTKQLVHQNLLIFSSPVPPFIKHLLHIRRDILSIVRPSGPGRQIRWVPPHPSNRFFSNTREFLLKLFNLLRLIAATEDYRARRPAVIVGSDLIGAPRLRIATCKQMRELSLCSLI
jgi:hypothetical protein